METVMLPGGETVPALGQVTWTMAESRPAGGRIGGAAHWHRPRHDAELDAAEVANCDLKASNPASCRG